MESLDVPQVRVLVLAAHDDASPANSRGALFERFIARLLAERFGFEDPTTSNLNVTSDGIELDVTARHRLTGSVAIAECKAYSRNVKANELTNFYGKLAIERFTEPTAFGLFCALPRLVSQGEEKSRAISEGDKNFGYLSARRIAEELRSAGLVLDPPSEISPTSDPAILITEQGLFGACLLLDEASRTPIRVVVWGVSGEVPEPVLQAVQADNYSLELPATAWGVGSPPPRRQTVDSELLLAPVQGSASDFEYQFPAGPKYFVGRKAVVSRLEKSLATSGTFVLNAQSGWGKSSLGLKLQDLAVGMGGHSLVLDVRTADDPRYVLEAVRQCVRGASEKGLLQLPHDESWASLPSALRTLSRSTWVSADRPLLLIFDQFENVFRDEDLTRAFRDLALGVREVPGPFILGFAWKTDLVGWTESHPYRLRDEIRSVSQVFAIEPFGPGEVNTLLRRLEREADQKLFPDLRSRLRAYSQGLPWLLKKLSDHILKELRAGVTQDDLLSESLNVQALFEADLAELNPQQQEALLHIARYAPIAASEVIERFDPGLVQSLVDRRLVVQVGDRLDTYWDTFRDFLNTGRVPIQDSYILRQTPRSVARLLTQVVASGGSSAVQDLARELSTSDTVVFNLSRELRLLGVTAYEPNRVTVLPEVLTATDQERELRGRVASALRKHRAYSALRSLSERTAGAVSVASYARELPTAFPAVEAKPNSWNSYARAFLFWITYAGLAVEHGAAYLPTPDGVDGVALRLLDPPSAVRVRRGVPQLPPRRAMQILRRLADGEEVHLPKPSKERDAVTALVAIGAVFVGIDEKVRPSPEIARLGAAALGPLLESVPGGSAGMAVLQADPAAPPAVVGQAIAESINANWTASSVHGVGGHFRAWAREAGIQVERPARKAGKADESQGSLEFGDG